MAMLSVSAAVEDLIARAQAERDGVSYAALQLVKIHLPTAAGPIVPGVVTGMPPFRAGDPVAGAADTRGLNRTT